MILRLSIATQLSTNLLLAWNQFSFLDEQMIRYILTTPGFNSCRCNNFGNKLRQLLVCTWRHGSHVGGQEQKHFSPLGTKLYFHVNSSRKYSFVLTPNMAALSRGCKPRIGTLSKYDDDGSENVVKKMNLPSFKLNRVYLDPLNMSNAGDLSWSWILKDFIQVQKEEGKFVFVCPRPP